ncbi:MAG: hypothetical protein ABJA67_13995 [Chthonomonadales bacterium]
MLPLEYNLSPPEWLYNGFPLTTDGDESLDLQLALQVCHQLVSATTQIDYTPLGRALHMAHMLVGLQGPIGDWPASWNGRTGEPIGDDRTHEPVTLFRELRQILQSTEFDHVISRAEAGISSK